MRLVNRALIVRRDRLRREGRDVVARREREVHLRGAVAEELGVGEIGADRSSIGRRASAKASASGGVASLARRVGR